MDVGKGKGTDKVFYFDQAKEKCTSFTYKGKGGNSNRFDSKKACEEQCGFKAPGKSEIYLTPKETKWQC